MIQPFNPSSGVPKTTWLRHIEHKEQSSSLAQRRSFFLGQDVKTNTRIEAPREALNDGHMWVEGQTGSGKTHVTLLSMILQAIRGYRGADGQWAPKEPVVVIDLKGDAALFHAVREAAEQDGRTFRFLSTQVGHGFHFFDPMQTIAHRHLEPIQLANQFIRAFSLDYGLTYGGLYYTDQNLVLLLNAIKEMRNECDVYTIENLVQILARLAKKGRYADARHILLCLEKLAEYPQINASAYDRLPPSRIDMSRALTGGEVLYFFFEMEDGAPSLRQIAGLALQSLVNAAHALANQGKPLPFGHVIIDEFYHIAGRGFGELLAQVRAWGLHFILSNQHTNQLESFDAKLPEVVEANTTVKQSFSVTDGLSADRWKRLSGPKIDYNRSYRINPFQPFDLADQWFNVSEFRDWQLSDDELNAVNDTKLHSLICVNDGKAKAPGNRVRVCQGLYPIFEWQYQRYRTMPIPSVPQPERRSLTPGSKAQPRNGTGRRYEGPWTAPITELNERMAAKWAAIAAEEVVG